MGFKNHLALLVFAVLIASPAIKAQQTRKSGIMTLADIEADPDGTHSMVRFLTDTRAAPESIIKVPDAYRKVQPDLLKHDKGYPFCKASNIYNLPGTAPTVEREELIDFLLQLTGKVSPALIRYKRVIITVIP